VVAQGTGPFFFQWLRNGINIGGATNSSYTIGAVSSANQANYTVVVTGQCGNPVTSSAAALTAYNFVSVDTQPSNVTICPNGSTSFTVAATAGNGTLAYQWQVSTDGGSTFTNLTNSGVYSNTDKATMSLIAVPSSYAGYRYQVIVSDACGVATRNISNSATLNFNIPTGISTQPVSTQTLCPGSSFTLSTLPSGTGGFTYRWAKNGTTIPGATASSFTIPAIVASDAASYTVQVTGACGIATSNGASLILYSAPVITQDLTAKSYCPGSSISLAVLGSSSPGTVNYAWSLSTDNGASWNTVSNISPYSGATSNTLSISGVPASYANYLYRTTLTDAICLSNSTTSASSKITPFANVVTTAPVSIGICPTGNVSFTTSATTSNGAASFQWQLSSDGTTFSNLSNSGIHSGVNSASLQLTGVSSTYNNYKYRVITQDGCSAVTQATSTAATLTVYTGAAITTQPSSSSICLGSGTSFSVSATKSVGTLTYQWWVNPGTGTFVQLGNTAIYSGVTTATLALTNPPANYDKYQYYVQVRDDCTGLPVTSNTVSLNFFGKVPVTGPPTPQTTCPGSPANLSIVAAANIGTLTYQWQVDTGAGFTNVPTSSPYGNTGTTANLAISLAPVSMDGFKYQVIVNDGCGASTQYVSPSVRLTVNNSVAINKDIDLVSSPCANGTLKLDVTATGTGLTYQWQENAGTAWLNLTDVGIYTGSTTTSLTLSSVPVGYNNNKYRLQIVGLCSSNTSATTTLNVVVPPTITADPLSITVCAASPAVFTAAVTGTNPVFQWQYSTSGATGTFTDIAGATSDKYAIASPVSANIGYYLAKVSNSCGSNVSKPAQLLINELVAISTNPSNTSICPSGSATISTIAIGAGPLSYSWKVSLDGGKAFSALIDGGVYSGTTTANLGLKNVAADYNNYQYMVSVSGLCGPVVNSAVSVLTVNPTPSAPTIEDPSRCGDGLLSATATSTAPSPSFNWYANSTDLTSVYSGATYAVNNITVSGSYYVTAVSLGCESPKKQVNYTRIAPATVPMGSTLQLCVAQGAYDLTKDITSVDAKGGTFSWSANNTFFTGNSFNPSVGVGNYVVTYTPTVKQQATPTCYIVTTRNISVNNSGGSGGIVFDPSVVSGGTTINTCVGNEPITISDLPSIKGGAWSTVQGNGINPSGQGTVFTPDLTSFTAINPNVFRYTIIKDGCSSIVDLTIFVKDNQAKPVITGLPAIVCPDTKLKLTASVTQVGNYNFQWFKAGSTTPFATSPSIDYTVKLDENILIRSVNTPFGCLSPSTSANVVTPFASGVIEASKTSFEVGDFTKFKYDIPASGNSFQWDFGDGYKSVEQNPAHYYFKTGKYTIKLLVNSNVGCQTSLTRTDYITVTGKDVDVVTGDIPVSDEINLSVFPNPFSESIAIESNHPIDLVTISDLTGKIILKVNGEGQRKITVPVSDIDAAPYILQVSSKKNVTHMRIVKK
jgi:hypothetical protein